MWERPFTVVAIVHFLCHIRQSISPLPCVTWQQQRPHEDELPARRSSFARPSGVEKAPFAEVSDAGKTQQAPPPALDLEDNPLGADNADNRQASVAIATGATTPWPGADFTLDLFLADSVYLWACGERSEGEGNAAVSRSEALAGWFVLFVSLCCGVSFGGAGFARRYCSRRSSMRRACL